MLQKFLILKLIFFFPPEKKKTKCFSLTGRRHRTDTEDTAVLKLHTQKFKILNRLLHFPVSYTPCNERTYELPRLVKKAMEIRKVYKFQAIYAPLLKKHACASVYAC